MTDKQPPATVADLMHVTGLGRETVKSLIRDGRLPGQKLGKKYVIPRGEFDRWYEGRWESRTPLTTNVTPLIHRRKTA